MKQRRSKERSTASRGDNPASRTTHGPRARRDDVQRRRAAHRASPGQSSPPRARPAAGLQQRTRSSGTYRMAMGDAAAAGAMIAREMEASLAIWDICRRACRLRPFLAAAHQTTLSGSACAPGTNSGKAQTSGWLRTGNRAHPRGRLRNAPGHDCLQLCFGAKPVSTSLHGSPAFNCSWKYDDPAGLESQFE